MHVQVFVISIPQFRLYSTAQSILSEWMNQKLRLELEMSDEEEEEEMEESKQLVKTTQSSYNNFDGTREMKKAPSLFFWSLP